MLDQLEVAPLDDDVLVELLPPGDMVLSTGFGGSLPELLGAGDPDREDGLRPLPMLVSLLDGFRVDG